MFAESNSLFNFLRQNKLEIVDAEIYDVNINKDGTIIFLITIKEKIGCLFFKGYCVGKDYINFEKKDDFYVSNFLRGGHTTVEHLSKILDLFDVDTFGDLKQRKARVLVRYYCDRSINSIEAIGNTFSEKFFCFSSVPVVYNSDFYKIGDK